MPYCDACQHEKAHVCHLAIPLVMYGLDAPGLLQLTYRSGVTTTDPTVVSDMLGVTLGTSKPSPLIAAA